GAATEALSQRRDYQDVNRQTGPSKTERGWPSPRSLERNKASKRGRWKNTTPDEVRETVRPRLGTKTTARRGPDALIDHNEGKRRAWLTYSVSCQGNSLLRPPTFSRLAGRLDEIRVARPPQSLF